MLRNINPILCPNLLHALRAMGHGDEIVIADANFPATSLGPICIRADGSNASEILRAVLQVMPLDSFVPDPALTMQVENIAVGCKTIRVHFQRSVRR